MCDRQFDDSSSGSARCAGGFRPVTDETASTSLFIAQRQQNKSQRGRVAFNSGHLNISAVENSPQAGFVRNLSTGILVLARLARRQIVIDPLLKVLRPQVLGSEPEPSQLLLAVERPDLDGRDRFIHPFESVQRKRGAYAHGDDDRRAAGGTDRFGSRHVLSPLLA